MLQHLSLRNKRLLGVSLVVMLAAGVAVGGMIGAAPTDLRLRTIAKGDYSSVREEGQEKVGKVIRDEEDWMQFWNAHTSGTLPKPPLPAVKFEKEKVIVVVATNRAYGAKVDIERVRHEDGLFIVDVTLTNDAVGELAPQIATSPFHFIKVRGSELEKVRFDWRFD